MSWIATPAAAGFTVALVGAPGAGEAEHAVALAGGRVVAHGAVPEAAVLALEAERLSADALAEALEAIATALADSPRPVVVALREDQINAVTAVLMGPDIALLVDASMAERVAALAAAGGLGGAGAVGESDRERLRRLNAEVARIAEVLARLTASDPPAGELEDRRPTYHPEPDPIAVEPQAVRQAIRARRLRDGFFPAGLFEDPAWDMLLDLFAAELEGGLVSVSSLCIAAAVAPTTALRWIAKLTEAGLLDRRPDPGDRRRAFMVLTPRARAGMQGYWAALARAGLMPA